MQHVDDDDYDGAEMAVDAAAAAVMLRWFSVASGGVRLCTELYIRLNDRGASIIALKIRPLLIRCTSTKGTATLKRRLL